MMVYRLLNRIFVGVVVVASSLAASAGIRPNGWHELKTTNFTLVTDLPVQEAKLRIQELELFRAVVLKVTNAEADSGGLPTKAYVFSRRKDFSQVTKKGGVLGWFRSSLRGNVMAYSAKTTGLQNRLVAQHEYVHSIMAASGAVYPRWYSEGLADMLGAIYIKDGRVVIGGEIVGRIKRLSAGDVYVPLSRIISKEDIWNWNVYLASFFYSMSWATVNYMYTGRLVGKDDHGKNLPEYLNLISKGIPSLEAFKSSFGISPKKMEEEVLEFLTIKRRGVLAIPADRFEFDDSLQIRRLDEKQVLYEIAYLMVERNPKGARKLFKEILSDDPSNKRAAAGIAVSWQMEKKWDKGLKAAAAALDDKDHIPSLEYADMVLLFCMQSKRSASNERLLLTAISEYEKVLVLKPNDPEAQIGLAKSFSLLSKKLEVARDYAKAVLHLVPGDAEVNYLLGHIFVQLGEYENALKYLLTASRLTHSERLLAMIRIDLLIINAVDGGSSD